MLIARLRRKIESDPKSPQFILTVPGLGYKFAARPQSVACGKSLPAVDLEPAKGAQTVWLEQSGFNEFKPANPSGQVGSPHSETGRRQVTALCCGLIGSTALAVNLDPEDFDNIIRHFQDICTRVITRWGGAVTNSVGDETLAVFGYPDCDEADAERAVHAGLDLVANVGEFLSSPAGPLQARIAIATGLVLIGENQPVIGEPVVMAARLRNKTPPNSLTITASTRKLLGSAFICEDLELHEFDGFCDPVPAYRVAGERAVKSQFAARRTREAYKACRTAA
jgi:class 3 adenylate cyclase